MSDLLSFVAGRKDAPYVLSTIQHDSELAPRMLYQNKLYIIKLRPDGLHLLVYFNYFDMRE